MKVIVNATQLIALAILERLELLHQLFEEVFVPPDVYREVAIQGGDRSIPILCYYNSWHIACAEQAKADILLTTDDRLLKVVTN